ncbi:MAG: polyhydroxyalkanoic acid system family protein [Lautropia sp.]
MSGHSIVIQRAHALGREDALRVARRIGDELTSEHGCVCRWDGEVLLFERTGVSGSLAVGERDIDLRIRLGFLLAGFRSRIEQRLEQNFDRYFGDPAARRST